MVRPLARVPSALAVFAAAAAAAAAAALAGSSAPALAAPPSRPAAAEGARFRPLDAAEPVRFPRDHGAHDDAKVEWWYVTGHLSAEGVRLGFQLTFFRVGLVDEPKGGRRSAWAARDLHLAHFAVTDAGAGTFRVAERAHRTGVGAAYAREESLDAANEGWRLVEAGGEFFLTAGDGGSELSLILKPEKPPVLNGPNGISRKGPEPDAVSKYVSFTRLAASGWWRRDARAVPVTGSAWLDHEWGSGSIGRETAGWDWFAVQLADGRDLMLYRLRGAEGAPTRFSSGTLVERDGRARPLGPEEFSVETTGRWKSPRSGADYPARWLLRVPSAGLVLSLSPLVADQELVTDRSTFVTYWEGACGVRSGGPSGPEAGRAYVEMTGYAGKGALGVLSGSAKSR